MNYINTILFFIALLSCSTAHSQRGAEVGAHIGAAHYFGDLNPTYRLSDPGIAFGIKAKRNFDERVSIAIGLDYGQVKGSDSDSNNTFERTRNLDFKSAIFDANFTLEFNFLPVLHGSQDYNYSPYLIVGMSMFRFNPKTEYNGVTYELRDLTTDTNNDYFLVSSSWVYGFGVKWDYNRDWSFNASLTGRKTGADTIDDVSELYPEYSNLSPIEVALADRSDDPNHGATFTQRGNDASNDRLFFLNIGVYKYFGRINCPPITKDLY